MATKEEVKPQSDVSYTQTTENGVTTITRSKGDETKEIATVKDGILNYPDKETKRRYHPHVTRFLNDEAITFNADAVSVGDVVDDEGEEKIDWSKAPRKTIEQGDKTPAFVEWLKTNYPKQFEKTYGVHGEATVTKTLKTTDPVSGRPKETRYEERALISDRKTHLTEKPDAATLANVAEDEAQ